jgi:hypothetical protein
MGSPPGDVDAAVRGVRPLPPPVARNMAPLAAAVNAAAGASATAGAAMTGGGVDGRRRLHALAGGSGSHSPPHPLDRAGADVPEAVPSPAPPPASAHRAVFDVPVILPVPGAAVVTDIASLVPLHRGGRPRAMSADSPSKRGTGSLLLRDDNDDGDVQQRGDVYGSPAALRRSNSVTLPASPPRSLSLASTRGECASDAAGGAGLWMAPLPPPRRPGEHSSRPQQGPGRAGGQSVRGAVGHGGLAGDGDVPPGSGAASQRWSPRAVRVPTAVESLDARAAALEQRLASALAAAGCEPVQGARSKPAPIVVQWNELEDGDDPAAWVSAAALAVDHASAASAAVVEPRARCRRRCGWAAAGTRRCRGCGQPSTSCGTAAWFWKVACQRPGCSWRLHEG